MEMMIQTRSLPGTIQSQGNEWLKRCNPLGPHSIATFSTQSIKQAGKLWLRVSHPKNSEEPLSFLAVLLHKNPYFWMPYLNPVGLLTKIPRMSLDVIGFNNLIGACAQDAQWHRALGALRLLEAPNSDLPDAISHWDDEAATGPMGRLSLQCNYTVVFQVWTMNSCSTCSFFFLDGLFGLEWGNDV